MPSRGMTKVQSRASKTEIKHSNRSLPESNSMEHEHPDKGQPVISQSYPLVDLQLLTQYFNHSPPKKNERFR
jgi:hypothetical protein